MKITALSIGTRGDIQPLIELGVEMIERGHDFRVAGMEKFRCLAEEKNVPFIHLEGDADRVMKLLVTDFRKSTDFLTGCIKLYRETPGFMDSMVNAAKGSDLVLYGTVSGFARHVCDYLGIPCARYFYSPFDRTDQYSLYDSGHHKPSVGRSYNMIEPGMNLLTCLLVNTWRKEHGLRKWRMSDDYRLQNGRKVLTFYPVSPVLMPPDPLWGEHIHVTGYWYHPQEDMKTYEPDRALEKFLTEGEQPIFVCFGKAESEGLRHLQYMMLEALKETGIRAVIQADGIENTDKQNSEQLFFVGNIPYSWIFQKVKAVVHHGGCTTNGLAIWAGCPALIIPLALDQFFYGRTIHEKGLGPEPLYIRKRLCTKQQLKEALLKLDSGIYKERAEELSERLRQEEGCRQAADRIEEYVLRQSKIKPVLNGTAETMLQSFYARAQYSKSKKHKFYDAKAVELVDQIDYDFSKAQKDAVMGNGVIARTLVFDELVKDFIDKNPDCAVVNIACGLDTRFYRMDNGKITWYNLDLPETIAVRDQIYKESGRVRTIGMSVLDPAWTDQVEEKEKMLFIIEGLSMYLTEEENTKMLSIIRDHFDHTYVLMECLAKKWVNQEKVEKSIQQTGAAFVFGADTFEDLGKAASGFKKVRDDNIIRGMTALFPVLKPFAGLSVIKKATQKILIFEKEPGM